MLVDRATLARFQRFIIPLPNGCWEWSGPATLDGYGFFKPPAKPKVLAHRWSFQAHRGLIPDGMQVDHKCHTDDAACPGGPVCAHRRCVNPAHLELVTASENTVRQRHAGRLKDHCPQGHPYDDANTVRWSDGKRRCASCLAARRSSTGRTDSGAAG